MLYKVNNEITYNSVKNTMEEEYWTFSMLKKENESSGKVSLQANQYDRTCSINLQIIGFDKSKTINANTKTKSGPLWLSLVHILSKEVFSIILILEAKFQ